MERLRIVLYGHSVLLDTLAAGLRCFRELVIIHLAAPLPETEPLAALRPDVVLFDIGAAYPQPAFALLQQYPRLRLIGLDADRNRTVVWSGQQLNELSFSDLAAILATSQPAATISAVEPMKDHTT